MPSLIRCKDGTRRGSYEHTSFTFLGFTFRARAACGKNGKEFTSFLPAASKDALSKVLRATKYLGSESRSTPLR